MRSVSSRRLVGRERGVEPAHELVRPRDLPVVRTPGVLRGVGLRRLVRIVRIVKVNPREPPLVAGLAKPRDRLRRRLVAALLDGVQETRIVLADLEPDRSTARSPRSSPDWRDSTMLETKAAVRKPCCCRISASTGIFVVERWRDVVADAVLRRIQTGEQRDVRRPRQRDVDGRVLGHRAIPSQAIQVRRLDGRAAVGAERGRRAACRW